MIKEVKKKMKKEIYNIYKVILKLIATFWGVDFLKFIEFDGEIKEILKTEIITLNGDYYLLDFLCRLNDETLLNIEFEFPKLKNNECPRLFDYNKVVRVMKNGKTETLVFNFTSKFDDVKCEIGKSITFHPLTFYLGDVDFEKIFEKINAKISSDIQLTGEEEIALMLRCLVYGFEDKVSTLKYISHLLKKKHLFDKKRYQYLSAIIKLEIENLISKEESEKILKDYGGELHMTLEVEDIVINAINQVNRKVLDGEKEERRIEGINERINESIIKGRIEGRAKAAKKIARNLKKLYTPEKISEITGLSIEEIEKL